MAQILTTRTRCQQLPPVALPAPFCPASLPCTALPVVHQPGDLTSCHAATHAALLTGHRSFTFCPTLRLLGHATRPFGGISPPATLPPTVAFTPASLSCHQYLHLPLPHCPPCRNWLRCPPRGPVPLLSPFLSHGCPSVLASTPAPPFPARAHIPVLPEPRQPPSPCCSARSPAFRAWRPPAAGLGQVLGIPVLGRQSACGSPVQHPGPAGSWSPHLLASEPRSLFLAAHHSQLPFLLSSSFCLSYPATAALPPGRKWGATAGINGPAGLIPLCLETTSNLPSGRFHFLAALPLLCRDRQARSPCALWSAGLRRPGQWKAGFAQALRAGPARRPGTQLRAQPLRPHVWGILRSNGQERLKGAFWQ